MMLPSGSHRWLTHQRILSAQQLLENSDRPIDWIAESVGLQTAATLRQHFRRILKTTPTAYRRAFFVTGRPGRIAAAASPPGSSRPR
jgi:transcriptional regulator GlxA family with amidase domain